MEGAVMALLNVPVKQPGLGFIFLGGALAGLLAAAGAAVQGQQAKFEVLRIGTSGTVGADMPDKKKDDAALETLKGFIKEETGFDNEIIQEKNWRELVDKLARGQVQLGVFQGYEFAWAVEKTPDLKPLALAVNVYLYPIAYVIVKKDNPAKDFAGLQSQTLAVPNTDQRFLRLFVSRQSQAHGKSLDTFFSKITSRDNVEDALDDVVDGVVQAVVADRAALEAYKRRKPGRFSQLKEVAHSQPFPPALVAYYGNHVDSATLQRFQVGLLEAQNKEKGQTMLTLFKLTGFEKVSADFGKIIAQTQKDYPPPSVKAP
jgi:ABC-type phosphate/phosphonate transport system substrate-binding protein